MGLRDYLICFAYTTVASLAVTLGGLVVLKRIRRRRLFWQLVVLASVTVLATATGIGFAARHMFLSSHDLQVLAFVLAIAAIMSVGAAMALARGFERSISEVAELATGLTRPSTPTGASRPLVTGELQSLAAELAAVSAQLEDSRQRAAALDAARRELVAWVSHDLRSPIASVRAMAEALEEGVVTDDPSVDRYHTAIRKESERLGSLVDDLFDLSRITAGAIDRDQTFVPLAELVSETLVSIESSASIRGIVVACPAADLPDALVPSSDMRRVLHNLLENAVRHTRPGGTVVLDGRVADGMLRLEVSDECGGIPEADLPRLFEVAFRGDASRQRDQAGGGLGLAIAKGLLEAHDGSIAVANRANGCRFVVNLPMVGAARIS